MFSCTYHAKLSVSQHLSNFKCTKIYLIVHLRRNGLVFAIKEECCLIEAVFYCSFCYNFSKRASFKFTGDILENILKYWYLEIGKLLVGEVPDFESSCSKTLGKPDLEYFAIQECVNRSRCAILVEHL